MNASLQSLIAEIKADKAEFDEYMHSPASAENLHVVQTRAQQELAYTLPREYLDLLALVDGIDSNGIMLYASHSRPKSAMNAAIEGIVEANLLWRENPANNRFVFFAESGGVIYCHNLKTNRYEIVDRIAQDVDDETNIFSTCEALLETLLNHMLDRYSEAKEG